jgi:hypothetical protein
MERAMARKIWLGFLVVFVTAEILNMVVNDIILGGEFQSVQSLFRPDMMSKVWIFHLITLIGSFFFSFIFSKGYENQGIGEGIRYGVYIGIWMSVPMAYGTYAMIAIPYSLALRWFIYGVAEYLIMGIVLALVFRSRPKRTERPASA